MTMVWTWDCPSCGWFVKTKSQLGAQQLGIEHLANECRSEFLDLMNAMLNNDEPEFPAPQRKVWAFFVRD